MIPIPDPTPAAPPALQAAAETILAVMKFGGLVLAVVALIVICVELLWRHRQGEGTEAAGKLMTVAVVVVIVSAPVSIIGWILGAR